MGKVYWFLVTIGHFTVHDSVCRGCEQSLRTQSRSSIDCVKLEFHDADTDSDSPDTSIHPYVRYARFHCEDPREEVSVGVGVGAVECELQGSTYRSTLNRSYQIRSFRPDSWPILSSADEMGSDEMR